MTTTSLEEIIGKLDDAFASELAEALEESPTEVRNALAERGLIGIYEEHEDPANSDDAELSEAEQALLDFIETVQNPKSTEDLVEMIATEKPKVYEDFESAKHRSWLNTKLNNLVRKGEIGKYRHGRNVYYTPEPEDAVRRWALYNDKFPEELGNQDIDEIVADTGMNRSTIITVLQELAG